MRGARRADATDHSTNVDRPLEANSGPCRSNPGQPAMHRQPAPAQRHPRPKPLKIADQAAPFFREVDEPDESRNIFALECRSEHDIDSRTPATLADRAPAPLKTLHWRTITFGAPSSTRRLRLSLNATASAYGPGLLTLDILTHQETPRRRARPAGRAGLRGR